MAAAAKAIRVAAIMKADPYHANIFVFRE